MPEVPIALARLRADLFNAAKVLTVPELRMLRGILADVAMRVDGQLEPAAPVDGVPHNAETAP